MRRVRARYLRQRLSLSVIPSPRRHLTGDVEFGADQGYPATTNTCGTTPSSGRADRLAGYNHRPGDSGRRCRAISRLIVSFRHVASPRWGAGMFRTGCIASLCGESPGPESGPLGSPGRSSRRVSACDAEGGDRIEVAQLLRGEAVAGTVPAGHVEA